MTDPAPPEHARELWDRARRVLGDDWWVARGGKVNFAEGCIAVGYTWVVTMDFARASALAPAIEQATLAPVDQPQLAPWTPAAVAEAVWAIVEVVDPQFAQPTFTLTGYDEDDRPAFNVGGSLSVRDRGIFN